jgi:hypothetical protein
VAAAAFVSAACMPLSRPRSMRKPSAPARATSRSALARSRLFWPRPRQHLGRFCMQHCAC